MRFRQGCIPRFWCAFTLRFDPFADFSHFRRCWKKIRRAALLWMTCSIIKANSSRVSCSCLAEFNQHVLLVSGHCCIFQSHRDGALVPNRFALFDLFRCAFAARGELAYNAFLYQTSAIDHWFASSGTTTNPGCKSDVALRACSHSRLLFAVQLHDRRSTCDASTI